MRIKISREAFEAIKKRAIDTFKDDSVIELEGEVELNLDVDVIKAFYAVRQPHETLNDTIIRIAESGRGAHPN